MLKIKSIAVDHPGSSATSCPVGRRAVRPRGRPAPGPGASTATGFAAVGSPRPAGARAERAGGSPGPRGRSAPWSSLSAPLAALLVAQSVRVLAAPADDRRRHLNLPLAPYGRAAAAQREQADEAPPGLG